jgi:hypothetical protein
MGMASEGLKFSGVMALFFILVFVGRTLDIAKILEIVVQRMVLFPILAKKWILY